MGRIQAFAASVTLALGWIPTVAFGYCVGWDKTLPHYDPQYYSVRHEFRRSRWVIKAKVLKETWIGEDGREKPLQPPFQNGYTRPWGLDPYLGAFYIVRVEQSFKGNPPTVIRIFSENTTARFWFKKGQSILIFVSSEPFELPIGKQLTLDTCGNSRTFPAASGVMGSVLKAAKARH